MTKQNASLYSNQKWSPLVLKGCLKLLRPKQWVKNTFVFAPLIFAGEFKSPEAITKAFFAFVIFSLAASIIYIFNDYHDCEADRKHPIKSKKRPIASGLVSKNQALVLLGFVSFILTGALFFFTQLIWPVAVYLILNLAYTFVLKHQAVIDIFVIALGFVLRVYAGAAALSVPISSWMFVTTLCLALYLAAIKRRQEIVVQGKESRPVLAYYSIELIDRYAQMAAVGALLFYSFFVMTVKNELVITIPFVLFGMFRYWFVVENKKQGESPTDVLLYDWQLLLTVVAWLVSCGWALWPRG